ncbi:MATE family efflux transporter [Streptomyces monticola]|uniref:Probable multidrug resistance protein NorM n=1 Tax=Streptomyces monticola TaxID=2666263 RepID=A0ABW2JSY6_9ACTN
MQASDGHRRRICTLARSVYGELLASVAAGIVNLVWVARLGGPAVAAVAVAGNVENLLLGVALIAGSGTTILVARARGAGDAGAVRAAIRGGWALYAVIAPMVAVGGFLLREPLARLVLGGAGPEVMLAAGYFAISLPGIAVFFAQVQLDGVLKGAGDTRTPMRLAFLANGLILVLDPLLIEAYGVRGAAVATVAGRSVALACGFMALRRAGLYGGGGAPGTSRGGSHGTPCALRRAFVTGLPMSADFTVRMAGSLALVGVVARLGTSSVAAYAIATKAMYVATMAFYAVRQAAAIHTAHTMGAGHDARRSIGRQAVFVAAAAGAVAVAVLAAGAEWIMRAFGAGPAVAADGALFLRCTGPYLLLMACCIALGGVFEGSGGARVLLRVTVLGVLLQLPLALGLSGLGLPGICLAMALAMGVQCGVVGLLMKRSVPGVQEPSSSLSRAG